MVAAGTRVVLVPVPRLERWLANFDARHGDARLAPSDGALVATAEDGATATLRLPFGRRFTGTDPAAFGKAAEAALPWGLLLVRRGGFAVARGTTQAATQHKVGRRHVQGRTKAGGWSQQRFARRRDNQARAAYDAAADVAVPILLADNDGIEALVCGGDRASVDAVLADRRLAHLQQRRTSTWLAVPDPTPGVLRQAIADAWSCEVTVTDPDAAGG